MSIWTLTVTYDTVPAPSDHHRRRTFPSPQSSHPTSALRPTPLTRPEHPRRPPERSPALPTCHTPRAFPVRRIERTDDEFAPKLIVPRPRSDVGARDDEPHKLTAGSGYDYLTRQVAAMDATDKGHAGLASYYTEKGETPGVWVGSGMAGHRRPGRRRRRHRRPDAEPVRRRAPPAGHRAHQGAGPADRSRRRREPDRGRLQGRRPGSAPRSRSTRTTSARSGSRSPSGSRPSTRPPACPGTGRSRPRSGRRIRTEVAREFFRAEHGREPADARELAATIAKHSRPKTNAVAGYDLTFSPVKSVSTLWALADPKTAAVIERAHQAAIKDALDFIETKALFTRAGHQRGPPGRRPRPGGHRVHPPRLPRRRPGPAHPRRGREQGPDPRRTASGSRSTAGCCYKAKVAASETYNTALERHLGDALGVRFAERPNRRRPQAAGPRDRRRRPRPEPPVLQAPASASRPAARSWPPSSRRPTAARRRRSRRCSWPSRPPWRPARPSTSPAPWPSSARPGTARRSRSSAAPQRLAADAPRRAQPDRRRRPPRSPTRRGSPRPPTGSWRRWKAAAPPGSTGTSTPRPSARCGPRTCPPTRSAPSSTCWSARSSTAARSASPDPSTRSPSRAELRRLDGSSVYTVGGVHLFTSSKVLAAEQRLVAAAGRRDGYAVDEQTSTWRCWSPTANGVTLNAGQATLVARWPPPAPGCSWRSHPPGRARPPRCGRSPAWTDGGGTRHRPRPLAAAADALRLSMGSQIDTQTDTLAKLTHSLSTGDAPRLGRRHRPLRRWW